VSEVAALLRSSVKTLEDCLRQLPQVEVETDHFFADGMYCRRASRDAGVLIVGKVHKREHFYCITKGRVMVTNDDGPAKTYEAGDVIVSRPGTKRAVLSLEPSTCMTVHRTDKTDLDEIEQELIEPDPLALFDARNKLRALK
jgi:hypothetical protein